MFPSTCTAGKIVALIGPNGAGKSSLFRTILGQVPHTGTIEFQRAGGDKTRPLIGYVPQSPSFDRGDPVSVFDFFSAAISRYPVFLPSPRSLRARVGACLARVHGRACWTGGLGPSPAASSSVCCWPWRWSRCPTFWCWTSPSQAWTLTGRSSFWTCWTRSVPAMTCPSCPPTTSPPWANLPTR